MIDDMAIRLGQRTRDGIYFVEIEGRRKSLGTRDHTQARALFNPIKQAYLVGRLSEITGNCTKSIGEYFDELETLGPIDISQGSHRNNLVALRKLIRYTGRTCKLDKVNAKHLHQLVVDMRRQGRAVSTINNNIRHARAAFRKAVEWGYVSRNPLKKVEELKGKHRPPAFLDKQDVPKFLMKIDDLDYRRFATALIFTGRRLGEMLSLQWQDIDLEANQYYVRNKKAHRESWQPLHDQFRAVLLSIGPREKGRLWPRWNDPKNVSRQLKKYLRKAGFGNLRAHDLRHTYGSLQAMSGVDVKTLQELMGHAALSTTMMYTHITASHLQEAANKLKVGPIDLIGDSENDKGSI